MLCPIFAEPGQVCLGLFVGAINQLQQVRDLLGHDPAGFIPRATGLRDVNSCPKVALVQACLFSKVSNIIGCDE